MEATTYNGWTNYETWVTALWLDNEAASFEYWQDQARSSLAEAPHSRRVTEWGFTRRDAAVLELAERLKAAVCEMNPLQAASVFSDLLWAAIGEIDWREIAGHYVDEEAPEAAKELLEEKAS